MNSRESARISGVGIGQAQNFGVRCFHAREQQKFLCVRLWDLFRSARSSVFFLSSFFFFHSPLTQNRVLKLRFSQDKAMFLGRSLEGPGPWEWEDANQRDKFSKLKKKKKTENIEGLLSAIGRVTVFSSRSTTLARSASEPRLRAEKIW